MSSQANSPMLRKNRIPSKFLKFFPSFSLFLINLSVLEILIILDQRSADSLTHKLCIFTARMRVCLLPICLFVEFMEYTRPAIG